MKLDRIDLRILAALQENGRISNAALADHVALSPSSCLQRVKRLERDGIVRGYAGLIDLARLGPSITVFTEVTLKSHRRESFVAFEAAMRELDCLVECHLVSGGFDYLLKIVARDVNDYQERMEALLERNLGIDRYFSRIVIKTPVQRSGPSLDIVGPIAGIDS